MQHSKSSIVLSLVLSNSLSVLFSFPVAAMITACFVGNSSGCLMLKAAIPGFADL